MQFASFIADWVLTTLILFGTLWVILRVIEKTYDIFLKHERYEQLRNEREEGE